MTFVTVRDLRAKSRQVWRRLAEERDLVLTANGRPIALMTAVSAGDFEESLAALRRARAMAALERVQSRSVSLGLDRRRPEEIEAEIRAARKARRR